MPPRTRQRKPPSGRSSSARTRPRVSGQPRSSREDRAGVRVAVDTGGTFTDVLIFDRAGIDAVKVPSTPRDPSRAIEGALDRAGIEPSLLLHGTTVGTNIFLTRTGPRLALLTTKGFEDVLEIGRQDRPALYNLHVRKPVPLVERSLRFGVTERLAAGGGVLEPIDPESVERIARRLAKRGIRDAAVCFLHAYRNSVHERRAKKILAKAGITASISTEVLPEFREYERTVATSLNAYLTAGLAAYTRKLADRLSGGRLAVMQSNGGVLSGSEASRYPVRTLLSGPAAGVVGGFDWARRCGSPQAITFDMGGTSTDVSLCPGRIETTKEAVLGGLPLAVPMIRIHTVGAGGGSIARLDAGGALRVGPESAGADPGPACYGKGRHVTVTDAHVHLKRILPESFLGGDYEIRPQASSKAIARLAREAGLSENELAEGVLEVADQTMEGALRRVSVARGHDPRDFTLVAFGGAGGLHACKLAMRLGIRRLIFPPRPGLLSAWGLGVSKVVRDAARTVLTRTDESAFDPSSFESTFAALEEELVESCGKDGLSGSPLRIERSADLRYRGQAFEIEVPWGTGALRAFHRTHKAEYGHDRKGDSVEVVTLRARASRAWTRPRPAKIARAPRGSKPPVEDVRQTFESGRSLAMKIYRRDACLDGHRIEGPALVVEYSATHYLPPGGRAKFGSHGEMMVEIEG